jgi:hypothetical protein
VLLGLYHQWSKACVYCTSTDFRNRGKKANKLGAAERGFLHRAVHKLVCTAGGAEQGVAGVADDGDLIAISPASSGNSRSGQNK